MVSLQDIYGYYAGLWTTISTRYPFGTNIYSREWDALLILDTCRVDALREVAAEYEFLSEVESIWSVGSTSSEWVANTFRSKYRDEIQQTVQVTANSHAKKILANDDYPAQQFRGPLTHVKQDWVPADEFLYIDHLWEYVEKEQIGHTPPVYLTDRAISVGRELDPGRLIIHYSQPHAPYSAQAINEDRSRYDYELEPFNALRNGASLDDVWDSYLDELRRVLDSVELLLENLDADKVVITADHGEAFGEWGMYGHWQGLPSPYVRRVPWATTTATDERTFEPSVEPQTEAKREIDEQLEALGYK